MVTASTKKLRDLVAIALLAYVGLRLLLAFIAWLTADGGFGFGFAERSYVVAGAFTVLTPVLLVVLAVLLVTHLGEPSKQARVLTIVAMAELGLTLLLGVVSWIAALTTDSADQLGTFGSIPLAGKAIGAIDIFVGFALVGLAIYFCLVTFNALPKPVRQAPAWGGGQPGWGPPPGQQGQPGQQAWGAPQIQQAQPSPQSWGQPDHGQADRSQSAPAGQTWGAPDPWGQSSSPTHPQQEPDRSSGRPAASWEPERRPEPGRQEAEPWGQPYGQQSYGQPSTEPYGQSSADPYGQPQAGPSSETSTAWGRQEDAGRESRRDDGPSWSEPQGDVSSESSASSWGQPTWGEPVQSQEYGTPRPVDTDTPAETLSESQPQAQPETGGSWSSGSEDSWRTDDRSAVADGPEADAQPAQEAWQPEPAAEPAPEPVDRTAQFEAVPAADEPGHEDTWSDASSDTSVDAPPDTSSDSWSDSRSDVPQDAPTGDEEPRQDDGGSSGWWNPGQR